MERIGSPFKQRDEAWSCKVVDGRGRGHLGRGLGCFARRRGDNNSAGCNSMQDGVQVCSRSQGLCRKELHVGKRKGQCQGWDEVERWKRNWRGWSRRLMVVAVWRVEAEAAGRISAHLSARRCHPIEVTWYSSKGQHGLYGLYMAMYMVYPAFIFSNRC